MIVEFEKLIRFQVEVDDNEFKGDFSKERLCSLCENSKLDETFTVSEELKSVRWKKENDSLVEEIDESEIKKIEDERDRAERCYECRGYGDDYDCEGNSMCETCSNNEFQEKNVGDEIPSWVNGFKKEFVEKVANLKGKEKACSLLKATNFSWIMKNPSGRIFLFAKNPCEFIKDDAFWNSMQDWAEKRKFGLICIGKSEPNFRLGEGETAWPMVGLEEFLK